MSLTVDLQMQLGDFRLDAAFKAPVPGVTALFGASGAGKSSLLAAIAGLQRPQTGRISMGERVLFDGASGINHPAHQRRVGVVFQDARLFPHLTVAGNIAYGVRRAANALPASAVDGIVDLLALGPLLARRPGTLSGGERQRVALARALAANPDLLALDEPLAALDVPRKAEILPYLEAIRDQGRTPMLYVSHAVEEVARLADHLVVLEAGTVMAEGATGTLLARPDLVPLFGPAHAGAILTARTIEVVHGLTRLDVGGQFLWMEAINQPKGTLVRVQLRALDVTLSLDPPGRTSANTVLKGRVEEMVAGPTAYVDLAIRLDPNAFGTGPQSGSMAFDQGHKDPGQPLLARVTQRSVDRLSLHPGRPVYCLIKAVTLHRGPKE